MKKSLKIFIIIFVIMLSSSIVSFSCFYFFYQPEIKLNGDKSMVLNIGDVYEEKGANVNILNIKNYDTDVRGSVDNATVGTYEIRYEFSNPFLFNKAVGKRIVKIIDEEKPIIKLKGEEKVLLYVGTKYTDPGYEATDKYDGDLTDKVKVTNNVNNTKEGTYEIIYEVSDSSNNSFSVKRIVEVKNKPTTTKTTSKDKNGDNTLSSGTGTGTGQGLPILMYHFFYDETLGEKPVDNNYMEIHAFEEQMKYLDDNDYYFPSWQEVADFVDGKINLPAKSVVVTIDDGHISFFKEAVPVIQKYDVKVTSFLVTIYNQERIFYHLKGDKFNFESHTHNMHRKGCTGGQNGLFRCINYDLGLDDLHKSISVLDSHEAIAYPFGDVTNNVLAITKAANFKVGVTTRQGKAKKGMDRYQLPRVRMSRGMTLEKFKNSL